MAWELTGNPNTDPNTNFLGTTDNEPLIIRTNGAEHLRVTPDGDVGIGTTGKLATRLEIASDAVSTDILRLRNTNAANPRSFRIGPGVGQVDIFAIYDDNAAAVRLAIDYSGNVGIGTTTPQSPLEVRGNITTPWGVTFQHNEPGMGGNQSRPYLSKGWDGSQGDFLYVGATGNRSNTEQMAMVLAGLQGVKFGTGTDNAGGLNSEFMRLTSVGNLGIGTSYPGAKLEVNGDVRVTGDVILTGADCAEEFDITEAGNIEPGTVMVIDQEGTLQQSWQAYDKRVAGVISGAGDYRPGLILDRRQSQDYRVPVALVGKVYCKVDAQYAPIEVGDLLTTSSTPGHAMKANDPFKAFGSVIGKALRPLEAGQGMIPILIALQ